MFFKHKNSLILFILILIKLCSSNNIELLTGDTVPINYNLFLNVIDLKSDTFSGIATIQIKCVRETNVIKLHSENLMVASVKLNGTEVGSFTLDNGFLNINLVSVLSENLDEHTLKIRYSGHINDDLTGLYRTKYLVDGDERIVAATFLPPSFARKIFPCYDEPRYKSTFELAVRHSSSYNVLANTEILSRAETFDDDTVIRTDFVKTPIMPSYLLAFTITDFVAVPNNGFLNVYVQPSKTNLVNLGHEFGKKSIAGFENYLDQKYQTNKMDFILFDDFLYGAMENWGLITYRSSRVYFDENLYSVQQYYNVLKIISHELAHQWFGNAVTCSWWSHTWLNEGFATFMEDYVLQLIYPELRNMDNFLIDTVQEAMRLDVSIDIKPMNNVVENTDQLSTIYDFIAYKKAGSVIRMIETFVSPSVFKEVIRHYIKTNSYTAVSPFELYQSFEHILSSKNDIPASYNITKFISSWADSPGYPVLNVRGHHNGTFKLTQQRFVADGSILDSTFMIPTSYISNGTNTTETLVIQSSAVLDILSENNTSDWVLFNVNSNGYYRVNYDLHNWNLLIAELINTGKPGYTEQIKAINRAQLIDDSFNLAKYNYLTFNVSIDLIRYIKNEVDLIPIKAALKNLDFLHKTYRGNENNEPIKDYIHEVIRPLFLKFYLNKPVDKILRLTRMEVFNFACKVGLKECIEYARTQTTSFVTKNIDADIRQGFYFGLARGNSAHLIEYMATLLATKQTRYDNFDELNEIFAGLSCIDDDHVDSILLSLVDKNVFGLTVAERQRILEALLYGDDDTIEKVLYFIRDNFGKLAEFNKAQLFAQISNNIVSAKSKTLFDDAMNKLVGQLSATERIALSVAQSSIDANLKWTDSNIASIIERIQYKAETGDDSDEEDDKEDDNDVDDSPPQTSEPVNDEFPTTYVIIGVLGLLVIITLAFVLRKCCRK